VSAKDFVKACAMVTSADYPDDGTLRFKGPGDWPYLTRFAEGVDTNDARWGRLSRFYSLLASSCTILAILRSTDGKCFLAHVVGHGAAHGTDPTETTALAKALRGYLGNDDPARDCYQYAMFTQGEGDYCALSLWEKVSVATVHAAIQQLTHNPLAVAARTIFVTGYRGVPWTVTSSGVTVGPGNIYCVIGDAEKPLVSPQDGQQGGDDTDRNIGMYEKSDRAGRAKLS
jgi:hypothetical protein